MPGVAKPLRVAFDVGPTIDAKTGVGRYASELARALSMRGVELSPYAVALRGKTPEGAARWRMPARAVQSMWRKRNSPPIERLTGPVDVVHATNFVLPALREARGVVTVHDLSFLRDDAFPGGERLRELVPWSVERAARVIVPTQAVGDEVVDHLKIDPGRVVVTSEGVAPTFFGATPLADSVLDRMQIKRPYIVAAGTIEPRKNLPSLLQAWDQIADSLGDWMLVLAGPRGWGPDLPETPKVAMTGWIGDETLPGLLSAAEIFCYPSVYEGFGLPPLEAMATGTPVVAGSYPCAHEVLADAAEIVDSTDVDALAETLISLAQDPARRKSLGFAGKARASVFTWEKTASLTVGAYEAALA
jgi:glycosyltransferase involved in cell wall biosynthesis